ncbi:MAG: HU family DNA-binding protein [Paludibacteraceae bacterium]|nr:HU family DNA-binding protein [Paludibacteraceae bacterium]
MDKPNKLSWVELRQQVAQRTGLSEKQVKVFMDSLVRQLSLAMAQDESVRLNGLGTFRTQEVQERKSVHVQTGEAITIPAYHKTTFSSEASLKNSLNNTVVSVSAAVNDPIQHLNEQADEIVGLLADLGQPTTDEPPIEVVSQPVEEEVQSSVEKEVQPLVETETTVQEPQKAEPQETKPEEQNKPRRTWLVTGVIMSVIIILLIVLYLLLQNRFGDWLQSLVQHESEEVEMVVSEEPEMLPEESQDTDLEANASEWEWNPDYSQLITTERITPGSRLAWIAKKYYGDRELWVFLYDANKDHLNHPSHILIGTPIRVPVLDEHLLDTSNPETQALMRRLKEQFIGKTDRIEGDLYE